MVLYEVRAYIDKDGHVEFDTEDTLPRDQQVKLAYTVVETVPAEQDEGDIPFHEMTEEEADAILAEPWVFEAKTAEEISASGVLGAWAYKGITDSVEYVQQIRGKFATP